jgi:hypothetical protein
MGKLDQTNMGTIPKTYPQLNKVLGNQLKTILEQIIKVVTPGGTTILTPTITINLNLIMENTKMAISIDNFKRFNSCSTSEI